MTVEEVPGYPDTAAASRHSVRKRVDEEVLAANLIRHTRTLQAMRDIDGDFDGEQNQTNNIVVAQCLSSSSRYSGGLLRWFPTSKFHRLSNSRMEQQLLLRLGAPTVHPLAIWNCDCRRRKPRQSWSGSRRMTRRCRECAC